MSLSLSARISACRICADRFAATDTAHEPRPVTWFGSGSRILIAGQAPGARVHASGKPFTDPSGDRLRDWMGLTKDAFYDRSRIAIIPMAFCFPGYNATGSDLPPPPICAKTWRNEVLDHAGPFDLTLLVGGSAQNWHLGKGGGVTQRVRDWRSHAPKVFPLPHPSWRNNAWIKSNPWFHADLLPALRKAVKEAL